MNEIEERKKIVEELRKKGIEPYAYHYEINAHSKEILEKYSHLKPEETTDDFYSIAGRVMVKRDFGKIIFIVLRDELGDIQLVANKQYDEGTLNFIKEYIHAGDIIGVNGFVFKTKRGETSLGIKEIKLLSKAVRPLPEKFHGLTDIEKRYRQRYLDYIVNLDSREKIKMRAKILKLARDFVESKGFIEVETPYLQTFYGGAEAEPFTTHLNFLDQKIYLAISPELYLKRLIIGGFEKVYHLARNFRNESIDSTHNPEFAMLELYQAYADLYDIMDLTEDMIKSIAKGIGKTKIKFKGKEIDLTKVERKTMRELLKEKGIDVDKMSDEELAKEIDKLEIDENKKKIAKLNRGRMIMTLFEEHCEDDLINPTIVYEYPKEVCPLTKASRDDPKYAERFEMYIGGIEVANAYSELNDPEVQRKNFEEQEKIRKFDKEIPPKDWDFIEAMEYGMPPTGGLGIGMDRIVMLLTESDSIKEVIPFPFTKGPVV